jgi:hypothetical protein
VAGRFDAEARDLREQVGPRSKASVPAPKARQGEVEVAIGRGVLERAELQK